MSSNGPPEGDWGLPPLPRKRVPAGVSNAPDPVPGKVHEPSPAGGALLGGEKGPRGGGARRGPASREGARTGGGGGPLAGGKRGPKTAGGSAWPSSPSPSC